jgi:hypothetical protein
MRDQPITPKNELQIAEKEQTFIGNDHPHDGRDWECQCARCGSSLSWETCSSCGGEGITGAGELHEMDPLWYDQDDYEVCHECDGESSFPFCLSSGEWCNANPMEGRQDISSGTPEWFPLSALKSKGGG